MEMKSEPRHRARRLRTGCWLSVCPEGVRVCPASTARSRFPASNSVCPRCGGAQVALTGRGLDHRHLCPHSSGGWGSTVEVPADCLEGLPSWLGDARLLTASSRGPS